MKAKYSIKTGNSTIEFEAEPLSISKCLQILRIQNKRWKGYAFKNINFSFSYGLKELSIVYMGTNDNLICEIPVGSMVYDVETSEIIKKALNYEN